MTPEMPLTVSATTYMAFRLAGCDAPAKGSKPVEDNDDKEQNDDNSSDSSSETSLDD